MYTTNTHPDADLIQRRQYCEDHQVPIVPGVYRAKVLDHHDWSEMIDLGTFDCGDDADAAIDDYYVKHTESFTGCEVTDSVIIEDVMAWPQYLTVHITDAPTWYLHDTERSAQQEAAQRRHIVYLGEVWSDTEAETLFQQTLHRERNSHD